MQKQRRIELVPKLFPAAIGCFDVTWISVSMGVPTRTSAAGRYRLMEETIQGAGVVTLSALYKGGWVAAIVKK